MEAGRQNVCQHGQIHYLGQSLVLVRELEQVEVSVGNHDVTGLSADPTAHVDIAIGATGATRIDRQADAGVCLTASTAPSTGDIERHRHKITQLHHLDVRALLDHLASDLVPEHHPCRGSRATADHMLVGPTDIGRDDLQDYAVLDLAALRVLELWISDILDLHLARPGVDDAAIPAHDEPLLNF